MLSKARSSQRSFFPRCVGRNLHGEAKRGKIDSAEVTAVLLGRKKRRDLKTSLGKK